MTNTLLLSLYSLIISFPCLSRLRYNQWNAGRHYKKNGLWMVTYLPYFISTVLVDTQNIFRSGQGWSTTLRWPCLGVQQLISRKPELFRSLSVWSGCLVGGWDTVQYLYRGISGVWIFLHWGRYWRCSRLQEYGMGTFRAIMPTIGNTADSGGRYHEPGFSLKVYLMQNPKNMQSLRLFPLFV